MTAKVRWNGSRLRKIEASPLVPCISLELVTDHELGIESVLEIPRCFPMLHSSEKVLQQLPLSRASLLNAKDRFKIIFEIGVLLKIG
jgi:hypothetical protein